MGISLLTPSNIKDSRREDLDNLQRRSAALATEESSLVRSLNLTRDSVEEQKVELEMEVAMFTAQAEDRKKVIRDEITGLEKKRDLILAPLEGREKVIAEKERYIADRENAVTEREGKVRVREEQVSERENAIPAREEAIKVREDTVQPKEDELRKHAEAIKFSEEALEKSVEKHLETVRAHNEHVATMKAVNDADARANEIERSRIAERQHQQDRKDREIADRYAQLEKTVKELGIT